VISAQRIPHLGWFHPFTRWQVTVVRKAVEGFEPVESDQSHDDRIAFAGFGLGAKRLPEATVCSSIICQRFKLSSRSSTAIFRRLSRLSKPPLLASRTTAGGVLRVLQSPSVSRRHRQRDAGRRLRRPAGGNPEAMGGAKTADSLRTVSAQSRSEEESSNR
jgi:hypothetical protein